MGIKKFFKDAFADMKASTKAQHEVDKANLAAVKAEAKAQWEEAKMSPKARQAKMQEDREKQIAEANERKAIADECVVKLQEEAPTHTPKQYKKLYLRVSDFSCREYLKAKNIVDIFDGNVKVIFYNRSTSSYSEYHGRISATTYIISELSELLGEENVVLK